MPESAPMIVATPSDADDITNLRNRLAQWMVDNGIEQWIPGEYPTAHVAEEAARGEWFVWRDEAGALNGVVRLVWRDPDFWGEDDDTDAGYVHGLMVAPELRGRGIGERILRFCADHTLANGVTLQRLDTAASNQVLRKYYTAQGFTELREVPLPPRFHGTTTVVLMEKMLIPAETHDA
ncbi:acetyltransferase (GNAT) family protein [Nocardia tenerifensis]|uniref:Acetyltransferase (GNAT) family protein n=1 Tax=Nocardia tenerifensis TaxID=228006 RepID=A0A318KL49_9NOCA|nr:GNAT family N-acetyltransferase [Nocardia tenerifensis]PXX69157.1 acetyltransferase (GNAT) family protein [Nocardia tenerifensis]